MYGRVPLLSQEQARFRHEIDCKSLFSQEIEFFAKRKPMLFLSILLQPVIPHMTPQPIV